MAQGYLNPVVFGADRYGDLTADILPAVQRIYDGCEAMVEAKRDIQSDSTLTEDGKLWELEQLFASRVERHLDSTSTALFKSVTLANQIKAEVASYFRPSSEPVALTLASELRATIRSLPDSDRQRVLSEAVASGDRDVILAVAGAHPLLTGVASERADKLRADFLETNNPALAKRVEQSKRLLGAAQGATEELKKLRARYFTQADDYKLKSIREKRQRVKKHSDNGSIHL